MAAEQRSFGIPGSTLVRVMLGLALLGLADAAFLTILHYGRITVPCTSSVNSCQTVQTSKYSEIGGVPVALLGLIGYIGIVFTLVVREREWTRTATLALTLFGFAFSAFLTWQETFTIPGHPIYCEWCVGSAVIMTILLALSLVRYLRVPPLPPPVPVQPRRRAQ
jgi:uncharacterized membrane protein